MCALSIDLRQRIVNAVLDDKITPKEAAIRFSTGLSSVYRYMQLNRDLGSLKALTSTGRTRFIPDEMLEALHAQVKANNDATLAEHCQLWQKATGIKIKKSAMHNYFARMKLTLKKKSGSQREKSS